jgi:predicted RNA-binding Zn-ribbon protein involved in translation (DUF1610 family)
MEGVSTSVRFLFAYNTSMPPRGKLDLEKIRAALIMLCPHCGAELQPNERERLDFDHLRCGKCGQTFTPPQQKIRLNTWRGQRLKGCWSAASHCLSPEKERASLRRSWPEPGVSNKEHRPIPR